jgi:membrane fusion protein, multidrug efflux system
MGPKAKRAALIVAAAGLVAAGTRYGIYYWQWGRYLESTDDAYVKADYTIIAPKISGYISKVLVDDNQAVKAGQVLARIDDCDYQSSLAQARANVTAAKADIANFKAQIELQQSTITQAQASVTGDEAAVAFAKRDDDRYRALVGSGAATIQRTQQADTDFAEKRALLDHDKAALAAAHQQVDVLQAQEAKAETEMAHSQAVEHQAALNVSYTVINSPINGTVGARSLRVGEFVQAGTQLMAVVPLDAVFVVANFKETQLTHIRNGEPVEVVIDSFPGKPIVGHIDSLSPASGLEFALLPPDNATGNFTKVVQRVPVKIVLDGNNRLAGLLRPGMSAEPTVDTKTAVLAGRNARAHSPEALVSR